jgi:hypothetical protein
MTLDLQPTSDQRVAQIARSALVPTSPIAHRSFDLRTAPERRQRALLFRSPWSR